ncbi:MAG TPA: RcpC/CpaB family pilus assembly protein [Elusimicrobiota bacterium]|nr:RcpC/CpaB family pilus assembly protein [Elusimicrobiota bacterium]
MTKTRSVLAVLLLSAVSVRASDKPAAAPAADVIVPLNVRDPSALVMGPGSSAEAKETIDAPAHAAPAGAESARVAKSSSDKAGPAAGKRAVSIPIDEDQLLIVKPGDRVDVLAVFDAALASGAKEKVSATFLQNVRVLGVATTGAIHGKGVLTLELNPIEAQYALLGVRQADLGVALRTPGDVEIYPMEMSAFYRFFR